MSGAAEKAARAVLDAHIAALNAHEEAALAETLHFPHQRLSGVDLKTWDTPVSYFQDFRARAGESWARSAFEDIRALAASDDKVHFQLRVERFDPAGQRIAAFPSFWIITREKGRWAVRFRSSFAPR